MISGTAHVERQFHCHFIFLWLWHTPSLTNAGVVDDDDDGDEGSCNLLPQNIGRAGALVKNYDIFIPSAFVSNAWERYGTDLIHTLMRSIFSLSPGLRAFWPCFRWEMISHTIKNQIDFVRTPPLPASTGCVVLSFIPPTQTIFICSRSNKMQMNYSRVLLPRWFNMCFIFISQRFILINRLSGTECACRHDSASCKRCC